MKRPIQSTFVPARTTECPRLHQQVEPYESLSAPMSSAQSGVRQNLRRNRVHSTVSMQEAHARLFRMKTRVLIAMFLVPLAAAAGSTPDLGGHLMTAAGAAPDQSQATGIADQAEMPGTGFHLVRSNAGQTAIISDNGRYSVTGAIKVHDNLNNQDVTDPAALHYFADRVDPKNIPLERMFTLTGGTGTQDLYVFVDPMCPICKAMVHYLSAHPGEYRVHLIPIGIISPPSITKAQQLDCLSQKDQEAAAKIAFSGDYAALPPDAGCNQEAYKHNLLMARLLGVEGVPFVIYSDGHYIAGMPPDMRDTVSMGGEK